VNDTAAPQSTDSLIREPERVVNVVAVQPNVSMAPGKTADEIKSLIERHVALSTKGLATIDHSQRSRLVIWPESPMNFTYASDRTFQELVANFTRENHTSLLFNSLEPAPNEGSYNSALLVNEQGQQISQYDKIRLMPFGEYVPLPQWLPGASLISGIVGEFTPGSNYTLMPFGDNRKAGVFICIESAYPWIARRLTHDGAGVLINISNDGYLGPTAVMRQHLANVIFRAVENGRPVMRVTNTGLSAKINEDGRVDDLTEPFKRMCGCGPIIRETGEILFTPGTAICLCTSAG
jgi:apolipoprotein N-acyltransferase